MKYLFLLAAFSLPFALFAQLQSEKTATTDTGIHFQHNLTWQQTLAKAKKENKYIFVDCFTTWCGPCRYMSKNIFPLKAVGDAMNDKFVAVKFQLDTAENDNADIKKLYADAHMIANKYGIRAYPTYLFLNPNGEQVHRALGSSDAATFIAKTNESLNPETQYYTQLAKYKAGKKDTAFLYKLTQMAMNAYDDEATGKVANEYLSHQSDLYTLQNITLLRDVTQKSSDIGFGVMMKNPARVDSLLGAGTANSITQNIILSEEIYPKLFPRHASSPKDLTEPNWSDIDKMLESKYPTQAASISAYSKAIFYMKKQDWDKFGPAVVTYMKSYGDNVAESQLNNFAWAVFQNCNDETCLQNALDWSKRSFAKDSNPAFMDTYANILYRLGKKDEAILWEQKAMNMVAENEKGSYQQTIDKIKAGEKTWN